LVLPVRHRAASVGSTTRNRSRFVHFLFAASAITVSACGSDGGVGVNVTDELASISIDTPSVQLERGNHQVFTATAFDTKGRKVIVPFVWRTSDEGVATVDLNGRVTAVNEGTTNLVATALGITSSPVGVRVVWLGAAKLTNGDWTAPVAATPSTALVDSIRVVALNKVGGPAANATIQFAVTGGGGTISVAKVTTDANGRAATQWTLGPNAGANSATATAVDDQGAAVTWVNPNQITFSVTSGQPLSIVTGAQQTGTILSNLAVAPSVKLVDGAGKPRQGIPVTFTPSDGGQVAFPIVSTGADGVASPGIWTLGDVPGDQTLVATVESAKISLHATATGTPIRFTAAQLTAGANATCSLSPEGVANCWGQAALLGIGDTVNKTTPTKVKGDISFRSIFTGLSHTCGIAMDQSLYCWGFDAFADTSGKIIGVLDPLRLGSDIKWTQVVTGAEHTCGLASDQTAYCWGVNSRGQLGIATADTLTRFSPVAVYGGFKFTAVTAGVAHSCGLTVDKTAFCWGQNQSGQLGDGTLFSRVAPTVVAGGLTFQSIGAGEQFTCGLTTAGKPYCWGAIQGGTVQASPQAVPSAPTFASISVGGGHACGLTSDGTAYCWGANNGGQLGDSTATTRTSPVKVLGGFKFASISAGDTHTCGRMADNTVLCWGLNRFGELGDAKAAFRLSPRYIILGVNP
jgi:alpha-tubulin suppressor-like RCC1 family protein